MAEFDDDFLQTIDFDAIDVVCSSKQTQLKMEHELQGLNQPPVPGRFAKVGNDQLSGYFDANQSTSTKRNTRWGMKIFQGLDVKDMDRQESERPYTSPADPAIKFYRAPTNGGNDHEINPKSEMVTSVGSQRQESGLRSYPLYAEQEDADQPASHTDHQFTAQVWSDSGSPIIHDPIAETGSPEQVLEEFVPNSALNQSAPKFRERESTYEGRLYTYNGWDHAVIDKEVLAEAGFYYTGIGDTVKCAKCGETLRDWTSGDDPRQQHFDYFGLNCF